MQPKKEKSPLKELVRAHCLDYFRRREVLNSGEEIQRRVRMEYVFLNSKIEEAVREVVGERLSEIFIKEIGESVGYAKSSVYCYSERLYKEEKKKCVMNIARKLYLI